MLEHLDVDGLRVAYRSRGAGPPLLLLHGGMSESREWHRQLKCLSDRWRVVAWDAPGCGDSGDPPPGWALRDYAACAVALCRELGLERPHVAGLSFGAGLALEIWRLAPAVPRSLVLMSAYAGWRGSLPAADVAARLASCLELSAHPVPPSREDGRAFTGANPTDEVLDELLTIAGRARPAATADLARAFAAADLRDVLPTLSVPVLLLHGAEDARCPLSVAQAIVQAVPRAELIVVPGAGHVLHQEAPEVVCREMGRFLSRVERSAPAGSL